MSASPSKVPGGGVTKAKDRLSKSPLKLFNKEEEEADAKME